MAPGPGHSHRDRALKISDGPNGEPIFHSFAGDAWEDVKDELRARGLLPERDSKWPGGIRKTPRKSWKRPVFDTTASRRAAALKIWEQAKSIDGTLGEEYLRHRGITTSLPASLRFASLKHHGTGQVFPTMVAGVQAADGRLCGIHRTFLKPDGSGKADVKPNKMAFGPIAGGTVRLALAGATVALVEGIEDGLAVQQMTGQATWVCLGTSGFQNFQPPSSIRQVILAPDADKGGDEAIDAAAPRLVEMGIEVRTIRPPEGRDWCDILMDFEELAAIKENDGEVDRATAEAEAWAEVFGEPS
jgi:hypothetical protein